MSHAEKCPICFGAGVITGLKDGVRPYMGSCTYPTCHGCGGRGWVTVESKEPWDRETPHA